MFKVVIKGDKNGLRTVWRAKSKKEVKLAKEINRLVDLYYLSVRSKRPSKR